jgi:hypothetical protein
MPFRRPAVLAIHLKLAELTRGVQGARTRMVRLEDWTDEELGELEKQFSRLRSRLARESAPLAEPQPARGGATDRCGEGVR